MQSDIDYMNDTPKIILTVHHQFPGVELVSPVYYNLFATCCLSPDQNIDVGSTMQANFNICPGTMWTIGILMYKLQRKNFDQPDEKAIFSEEVKCIQLVITWKVDSQKFYVNSYLIEHDEGHVWDRVRLTLLAYKCELVSIQHSLIEDTWLMHDNTVLMTSLNATHEEERYKLEMTISEANIKDDTQRPDYVDLER
jgi:hypothetical protein